MTPKVSSSAKQAFVRERNVMSLFVLFVLFVFTEFCSCSRFLLLATQPLFEIKLTECVCLQAARLIPPVENQGRRQNSNYATALRRCGRAVAGQFLIRYSFVSFARNLPLPGVASFSCFHGQSAHRHLSKVYRVGRRS